MTEKERQYYDKALEFAREVGGPYADIDYLGVYEEYEVYQLVFDNDTDQNLVGDFILANDDMVYRSYYHESVDIASKFNV